MKERRWKWKLALRLEGNNHFRSGIRKHHSIKQGRIAYTQQHQSRSIENGFYANDSIHFGGPDPPLLTVLFYLKYFCWQYMSLHWPISFYSTLDMPPGKQQTTYHSCFPCVLPRRLFLFFPSFGLRESQSQSFSALSSEGRKGTFWSATLIAF